MKTSLVKVVSREATYRTVKVLKCPCCVSGLIFPGTKKDKKKFVKRCMKKLKRLLKA